MGFLSGFSKVGFVENYGLYHNQEIVPPKTNPLRKHFISSKFDRLSTQVWSDF